MAVTSVILDIKANTDRALNDFKRFSAQLDNKFLISGLKLDVVRNALGQINREFQKAIGEQGLQAGQSLRAAQNQAALLTQTFKGFSSTASLDMAQQFSTAFNEIAVKAGGTAQDIQKALSATPFISTNLSADMRKALGEGVLSFQRDFRRAGLGDDFGGIARQFLMGQLTAGQMIESGDAIQTQIGLQLSKKVGIDYVGNAQQRSQALLDIVRDPEFIKQLSDMARRASGFRSIIEDLNSQLFNPEKGVFGALRRVTMSVKDKTTIFDETEKLINSVFGRQGLFVNFFKQIAKIFGLEDPLKLIIIGVRFITKQFDSLNKFVQSPEFQNFVTFVKEIFTRTRDFFTGLYNQVTAGTFDKQSIITQIKDIGETIRSYIKRVAATIRGEDISKEADFGTSIIGTLVEEIGKTFVTLVAEIGGALLPKAGQIALGLTGALIKALGGVIGAVFSNLLTGTLATGFLAYKGARLIGGVRDILDSPGGIRGTANRMLGRPFRPDRSQSLEDRGLASTLGSSQSFHRQVIYYLSRIHACVCAGGFGGGGGIDIDADTPEARRERARTRRGPTGPGMPRRAPLTSLDTINPYAYQGWDVKPTLIGDDARYARSRADREARKNAIRNLTSTKALERYSESMRWSGGYRGVPLDDDERLEWARESVESDYDFEKEDRVRKRYRRRFGKRARFGRAFRGFGRGALIAGGIGLAGAALFGGGNAQASEFDPMTGEPIQRGVGAGEAFGRVGMGAAEGALTGAMFGPWGAAIGAAVGGGVALFDKGVRDAIGKSIVKFGSDSLKWLDGLRKGFLDNMMKAFDGIKNFTSNIDWGNLILDVIFPGRGIARTIAEASGVRPSGQNGGGVVGWLQDRLAEITGREVGGTVIRGSSYIVGERGPEIFTPGQTGTISSNRELMALGSRGYGGSSVSANFNIAINVNGNMGAGDVEALRAPVLAIVEEAWASATQGTVSRGALA